MNSTKKVKNTTGERNFVAIFVELSPHTNLFAIWFKNIYLVFGS